MDRRPKTDPYEILGVSRTASATVIKSVYRQLAKECHPDLNPGVSDNRFAEIAEAYSVLSDLEMRAYFDLHGKDEDDLYSQYAPYKEKIQYSTYLLGEHRFVDVINGIPHYHAGVVRCSFPGCPNPNEAINTLRHRERLALQAKKRR